ncbi:MAG: hypothetical protein PVF87_01880 [Acidimicrobiia bacterium]|jgi:hypothetical protein
MITINRSDSTPPGDPNEMTRKKGFRMRRTAAALLLVLSTATAGCTPEEIEGSMEAISVSFEQGGAERGLAEAIFVLNLAIPIAGMRLQAAFGP